jgi:hypothetical protein
MPLYHAPPLACIALTHVLSCSLSLSPPLLASLLPPLPPSSHPPAAVEELAPDCLGRAGLVYEHVLGEDKFTFVEDVANPSSCTVLIKGPNDYTISQVRLRE